MVTRATFSKFSKEANEALDSNRISDYDFACKQCQSVLNSERGARTKLVLLMGKESTFSEDRVAQVVNYQKASDAYNAATEALSQIPNLPRISDGSQLTNTEINQFKERLDQALNVGLEDNMSAYGGVISLEDVKKMISWDRKFR